MTNPLEPLSVNSHSHKSDKQHSRRRSKHRHHRRSHRESREVEERRQLTEEQLLFAKRIKQTLKEQYHRDHQHQSVFSLSGFRRMLI